MCFVKRVLGYFIKTKRGFILRNYATENATHK